MPVDRLSTSQGAGGLARSDSSVLPRDSVHRNMFSLAPDAPPMPPDAETQYVAPKRPRAERRKQMKRRSSTGTLSSKVLPDLPNSSRRASLILSIGPEFGNFLKSSRPWSSDTAPVSSPTKSNPHESITPSKESTKSDDGDSFALPTLPEGVRRLPNPRSQPSSSSSAGVSPSVSAQSSAPSKDIDTKGLEDVLDFYNLGDSPGSFLSGFRLGFSPIREETGSQASSANRNDRRDSKRAPPVGARSPRSASEQIHVLNFDSNFGSIGRGDSLQSRLSDARPLSKQMLMLLPSQNGSSGGLSERSGSLKSCRSFEPQRSDSASSYSQDTRSYSGQKAQGVPLQTSTWTEASSPGGVSQRSNEDGDSRRNVGDDAVSAKNSSGRVSQSDGNYATDSPHMMNLNTLPSIPISPIEIVRHNQPGAHSQMLSEPSQTGFAAPSTPSSNLSVSLPLVRSNSLPMATSSGTTSSHLGPVNGSGDSTSTTAEKSVFTSRQPAASDRLYKDDFLGRNSTLSMGSPPPYYEVVNQSNHHHPHHHHDLGPSTINAGHVGPTDPVAGPSRLSGEWSNSESRRDGPARARIRPRPPLPIGPRRPSQGIVTLPSSIGFPESLQRSESMASLSRHHTSGQQSPARLPAIRTPRFQTPPPKWRGHTMDAARWTFKSCQLQSIVSKAIRQSSEASLIRLLEPEILENDIPAEIGNLETIRTDIKTRYKLLARKRAVLFEGLSSSLAGTNNPAEEGPGHAHRLLEDLSEIAAMMDHLSEELHSADTQLAHLDSLTQVHTSSALAVALRKLNTSFLKQMTENEDIRNDLFSVEAERDEAWLQAERIAIELDQLAARVENTSSPITSNRSSRVSAHRKSLALASKAGLKIPKRQPSKRLSLRVTPSSTAFSSPFVSPSSSSKGARPGKPTNKQPGPISTESSSLSPPVPVYSPSSTTRALIQAQDELYTMLGLSAPGTGLQRSRSWTSLSASSPQDSDCPSLRHSLTLHPQSERRNSLPADSALAQVSNAMAADVSYIYHILDRLDFI